MDSYSQNLALGGGHGLASVLLALDDFQFDTVEGSGLVGLSGASAAQDAASTCITCAVCSSCEILDCGGCGC